MSNIVFILGAGASKQAGAPLMANFLDVASDLLLTGKVENKRTEFERVFAAIGGLQAVHSKAQLDLNNIESIFTALELGRIIQRVPGLEASEIAPTITALKGLIVKTLEATMRFPSEAGGIGVPKPYEAFAELVKHLGVSAFPARTACVITFNYDVAADIALYRAGLGPNYAIDNSTKQGAVDLLKLHGSLNWAIESDSNRIRPLHMHDYFETNSERSLSENRERSLSEDRTAPLPIGSKLVKYFAERSEPSVRVRPEPVIVPPSWNKADYHSALSDVWSAAAVHLAEAKYIFIAGYSLPETDSFFRHLFALGSVGSSTLRKLVVFNPDPAVDARFRALLGPGALARYEFDATTFDAAISKIKLMFPARSRSIRSTRL